MEDQLRIAKEQIANLKEKATEVERAKGIAKFGRDKALRAKDEADFGRAEAQASKEEAEEAAYASSVAETEAALKAQVPGVCQLYCSQVWNEALRQAGIEASSDLWKVENVYYPPAIREAAPSSSEAEVVSEEVGATPSEDILAATTCEESTKEADPSGVIEIDKGSNKKAPQEAANPSDAQAPLAEETAPPIVPPQAISPG